MATTPSPKPAAAPAAAAPSASDPNADIKEYVVLAHAITYRTGKAKKAVSRFVRGARLRLHSEDEIVKEFIQNGAIGLRGEKHPVATPASIFKRMGAADDPAKPPMQDVLPTVAENDKAPVTP